MDYSPKTVFKFFFFRCNNSRINYKRLFFQIFGGVEFDVCLQKYEEHFRPIKQGMTALGG